MDSTRHDPAAGGGRINIEFNPHSSVPLITVEDVRGSATTVAVLVDLTDGWAREQREPLEAHLSAVVEVGSRRLAASPSRSSYRAAGGYSSHCLPGGRSRLDGQALRLFAFFFSLSVSRVR
ncbi:DUF5959 family protein [Streptomyces massasporeus]|uniref:DUF5959 family protein n=1 Tax=Streptomyces massasporeus TaxID=67324 RepID=UPI0036E0D6A9